MVDEDKILYIDFKKLIGSNLKCDGPEHIVEGKWRVCEHPERMPGYKDESGMQTGACPRCRIVAFAKAMKDPEEIIYVGEKTAQIVPSLTWSKPVTHQHLILETMAALDPDSPDLVLMKRAFAKQELNQIMESWNATGEE